MREDSLRSSNDIKQNSLFNKSTHFKSQAKLDEDEQKKYSETPKVSNEKLDSKFSYNLSKNSELVNSGENNKESSIHLMVPNSHFKDNSNCSKDDFSSKPTLPIRPSSKRRMNRRKSSRLKPSGKINKTLKSMCLRKVQRVVLSDPRIKQHLQ
jgi:hypothetical protein